MAAKRQQVDASLDKLTEIATALEHIKRLLIFALLRNDASQAELGAALGMSQSSVSRLIPGMSSGRKRKR